LDVTQEKSTEAGTRVKPESRGFGLRRRAGSIILTILDPKRFLRGEDPAPVWISN